MADYYTSFSVLFPLASPDQVAPALALYEQLADKLDAEGEVIGFEAEAGDAPGSAELWLHDGSGQGEPEHVITFALRCAKAFGLTGLWGFRWCLSCSKPRLDGYGGGAQVLDLGRRRTLDWLDCDHWLTEAMAEPGTARTPVEVVLYPVATAQCWTRETQAQRLLAFVDAEIAADPRVADRLRAFLADAAKREEEMLCRECGEPMFIRDDGVSHHEGGGPDGIDHALDGDHVAVAEVEPGL